MRRWVAILLLIVMPFQLGWAVAASYCTDEAPAKASHFGHHFHGEPSGQHGDHADLPAGKGKPASQHDCGCAGQLCGPQLQSEAPAVVAVSTRNGYAPAPVKVLLSAAHHRIDRPNWPVAS